jgi:CDP-diacylglycerol--glycerol-3-phosphate 3-phosphatidyltransferase
MSPRFKFLFVTSLTLGRIPLIFIFFLVSIWLGRHVSSSPFWFAVAFGSMVLSALTDLFDGYFARKFKMETKLGALADPLTDKIFYLVSFPTLVYMASLDGEAFHSGLLLFLTIVFLIRDQWVSFLRSIGMIYQMDVKANWSGKARTAISFPTICAVYWYLKSPETWWLRLPIALIYTLEVVSLAINMISIYVYSKYYWPCLVKESTMPGGLKDKHD